MVLVSGWVRSGRTVELAGWAHARVEPDLAEWIGGLTPRAGPTPTSRPTAGLGAAPWSGTPTRCRVPADCWLGQPPQLGSVVVLEPAAVCLLGTDRPARAQQWNALGAAIALARPPGDQAVGRRRRLPPARQVEVHPGPHRATQPPGHPDRDAKDLHEQAR